MKIAVVKPSSLGDVLHTLPAVALIRRHLPSAFIAWVVNEELASLVETFAAVDQVIIFRRRRWHNPLRWFELLDFRKQLLNYNFDLALDFQGLLRSALICRFCGASERVGFTAAREGADRFYSKKIAVPDAKMHALEKNLHLVQTFFGFSDSSPSPEAYFQKDPQADAVAAEFLAQAGIDPARPLLGLAPVARWQSKSWPADFYAKVIDGLHAAAPELNCWLAGTAADRLVGDKLLAACKRKKPLNLMGKTDFPALIALLRRTDLLLTGDTGPMHLAAALQVPVVALFGPTRPELTGPYGAGHIIMQAKNCSRSPCMQRDCARREHSICHQTFSPEQVVETILTAICQKNNNKIIQSLSATGNEQ